MAMAWEQLGLLVGVLSPLVGIPLMVITFHLRAIREHQSNTLTELTRRIDAMETSIRDLCRRTASFEREYTTKEEWVREAMLARQRLEKLTEMMARIEADLDSGQGLVSEVRRATAAMADLAKRMPRPRMPIETQRREAVSE